jgi:hypothetical protein
MENKYRDHYVVLAASNLTLLWQFLGRGFVLRLGTHVCSKNGEYGFKG